MAGDGTHLGVACTSTRSCPFSRTGPGAMDEWVQHSKETGHKEHRWTNVYGGKVQPESGRR